MKLVYVAGPFSARTRDGVEANIRRAERTGIEVSKLGAFPVIPHTNTSHPDFEHTQPYQFWIEGTLLLLGMCHALILSDGWESSSGAKGEKKRAEELGLPVFYSLEALKLWLMGDQA